jgi:ADP-ribosylglycohydrolase
MSDKIESLLIVSFLLDLIGSNIYYIKYKDLLKIIKNPNDLGEILIEYTSYFLENGGINNFDFNKNIQNSSNIIFMMSLFIVLLEYENDNKIMHYIKKNMLITFTNIFKSNDINFIIESGLIEDTISDSIIISGLTEEAISKIKFDDNYIGEINNNFSSDICVRIIPIGIIYFNNIDKLITMSLQITKLTHNNIISILSSIAASYFVSLAINNIPIEQWSYELIKLFESDKIKKHINLNDNKISMVYFTFMKYWIKYNEIRFEETKIKKTKSDENLIFKVKFYQKFIYDENEMILGKDCLNCIIISYDVLLNCNGNFEKIIYYAMLIPGEILAIGGFIGALFGLTYRTTNIPLNMLNKFEFLKNEKPYINVIKKLNNKILIK